MAFRGVVTGAKLLLDPSGFIEKLRDHQAEFKLAAQSFGAHLSTLAMKTDLETMQLQYTTAFAHAKINSQLEALVNFKEEFQVRQTQMEVREHNTRVEVLESIRPLLNNLMNSLQQKAISAPQTHHLEAGPHVNVDEILTEFLYERDLVKNDCSALAKLLKGKHHLARYDMNRISALSSHPQLRAWLTVDEPSLILLNGRADARQDSEVSLYTAKLVYQLLEHHRAQTRQSSLGGAVIPLAFFCGQHRDWQRDDNGSPEELAMSLLLQLVDRGQHHLDTDILRTFRDHTIGGDIVSICSMFGRLVSSFGREVIVMVVIDGLRYFAHPPDRGHGTKVVVSRLVEIHRRSPQATLKFLFTSPTKSHFLEDLFTEEEVLEMPRDIPATGMESSQWLRLKS
ncbi:hypothetical protein SLS60_006878 [Paraconiothyrium brasiliense]|uniref:Uncharacterized protein n=1 Tax=Paraconiothyrium brasiliense TaxID=300254 RepID=A0ABR3R945_9PLEO